MPPGLEHVALLCCRDFIVLAMPRFPKMLGRLAVAAAAVYILPLPSDVGVIAAPVKKFVVGSPSSDYRPSLVMNVECKPRRNTTKC